MKEKSVFLEREGYSPKNKVLDFLIIAQERMKQLYEQKGYSKSWIDKRLRGIAVRQDLTDVLRNQRFLGPKKC